MSLSYLGNNHYFPNRKECQAHSTALFYCQKSNLLYISGFAKTSRHFLIGKEAAF